MDISRARYFHVFSETGSLVKAAEMLNISQPALSKALKLLEREVGVKLIEPDGRGLRLTKAGTQFKKETGSLLEQWLQIPQKMQTDSLVSPTKIGSFEVFTTYFLGYLTGFADLELLDIYEFGPGKLEQAIIDRIIDIGITYVPIPMQGIELVEITKIKMATFGLKKFKNTPLKELPFAVPLSPIDGTPSKVMGLDGWPEHKFPRNIKFRVTMMESAMELCRRGKCVAYLPEFVAKLHNESVLPEFELIRCETPIPIRDRVQSVYMVLPNQVNEVALHRKIAKCLRSLS